MFRINRKKLLPAVLLAILLLTSFVVGCGSRQSNTGSFRSRLIDEKGDVIINAKCFSLFKDDEVVYSGLDGGFRLSELPAGLNNIIIQHKEFALEQYQVQINSDKETAVDFIRLDRLSASNRISNIKVGEVSSTTAEINWQTYKELCCNIHYGTTTGYGSFVREERPQKIHYYKLTGLEPETVYHFKVQYLDENSNNYYSYDYTFKTTEGDTPNKPETIKIEDLSRLGVVTVSWNPPMNKTTVAGYNVYRQKKGESWVRVNGDLITSKLSFSDVEAESGIFCRYAVAAVNNVGAESEKTYSDLFFVPGVVKNNITITKTDSPVKLTADLIIPSGVNLVVEAGSEFLVSETDSFKSGFDEDRVEILVHGTITVNGTKDEKVAFAPLDGSGKRDHWAGIRILSSENGISSVRNAEIFGCNGYALNVLAENVAVSGISVKHSCCGLRFDGVRENIDVADCIIDDIASVAVSINKCFHVLLTDSKITNTYIGVETYTDNVIDQTYIRNTDIYATFAGIQGAFAVSTIANVLVVSPVGINYTHILNTNGVNILDHVTVDAKNALVIADGVLKVTNNIFTDTTGNGEIGINYKYSGIVQEYNHNDIYGFATPVWGCSVGTESIAIDPVFVGGSPFSYELNEASILRINDEYGTELGRYGNSRK